MALIKKVFDSYPVLRGMATYVVLYPTSNLVQQLLELGPEDVNVRELGRFALFGSMWVAPTVYTWIKISSWLLPKPTFNHAVKKVLLEQVTYSPFAITTFFTGMNLLQGKGLNEAKDELSAKFLPTFKSCLLYWPFVQTINFSLVPERNRAPVVGVASLLWVSFLSYMKRQEVSTKEVENCTENLSK